MREKDNDNNMEQQTSLFIYMAPCELRMPALFCKLKPISSAQYSAALKPQTLPSRSVTIARANPMGSNYKLMDVRQYLQNWKTIKIHAYHE